jgi:hypothetical protein
MSSYQKNSDAMSSSLPCPPRIVGIEERRRNFREWLRSDAAINVRQKFGFPDGCPWPSQAERAEQYRLGSFNSALACRVVDMQRLKDIRVKQKPLTMKIACLCYGSLQSFL